MERLQSRPHHGASQWQKPLAHLPLPLQPFKQLSQPVLLCTISQVWPCHEVKHLQRGMRPHVGPIQTGDRANGASLAEASLLVAHQLKGLLLAQTTRKAGFQERSAARLCGMHASGA